MIAAPPAPPSKDRHERFGRVLLPLTAAEGCRPAIEMAAALAKTLGVPLETLFIEDEDLLSLASLPFTRDISTSGFSIPGLDLARIEQDLKIEAGRARRALESIVRSRKVTSSFAIVRGRTETTLTARIQHSDFIAVGRCAGPIAWRGRIGSAVRALVASDTAGPRAVLVIDEQRPPRPGPVTAIFDGSEISLRVLDLAARLAGARGEALRVLLIGEADRQPALRAAAADRITVLAHLEFEAIARPAAGELAERLGGVARGMVIVAADLLDLAPGVLDQVLAGARCPLILLRPSPGGGEPRTEVSTTAR